MSRTTAARIDITGRGSVIWDKPVEMNPHELNDWMQALVDEGRITTGVWIASSWSDSLSCAAIGLYRIEERDEHKMASPFCPDDKPTSVDVTRWPPRK